MTQSIRRRVSRRAVLRSAGATAMVGGLSVPAAAAQRGRSARRQTVAVFGGGIAGLTAAHELAERGFDVTVCERRAWGGKARSTSVPGSGHDGRLPLPGEHSWRLFAGFYQNLPDTMRRIPYGSNSHGVFDNLVSDHTFLFARANGRADFPLDVSGQKDTGLMPLALPSLAMGLLLNSGIPAPAVEFFVSRLVVYFSSCDARRIGDWENTRWTDFVASERYGEDYRRILVDTLSRVVQASRAESTSAAFPAHVFEWILSNVSGRGANGPFIRSLNKPTNEAFIDPWLRLLRTLGVKLLNRHEITRLEMTQGRISAAYVRSPSGTHRLEADWYVLGIPVERARELWNPDVIRVDPHLAQMWKLDTDWMNGLKLFLNQPRTIAPGHVDYVDSPWRVTSVSQSQLWDVDIAATYGDGRVRESLSAIISDWHTPGVLFGKPAADCTEREIVAEVWEQMKRHLNKSGRAPVLTDDLLESWNIDPGMERRHGRLISHDPLVLPAVGQRAYRPDVNTAIANLKLCGDYLKGEWEVAIMEAASYNGRRAANAVIDASGGRAEQSPAIPPYSPPEWAPLRALDADRYAAGQPNLFEHVRTFGQVKALLTQP